MNWEQVRFRLGNDEHKAILDLYGTIIEITEEQARIIGESISNRVSGDTDAYPDGADEEEAHWEKCFPYYNGSDELRGTCLMMWDWKDDPEDMDWKFPRYIGIWERKEEENNEIR